MIYRYIKIKSHDDFKMEIEKLVESGKEKQYSHHECYANGIDYLYKNGKKILGYRITSQILTDEKGTKHINHVYYWNEVECDE